MLIPRGETYEEIRKNFEWKVPERFSMARQLVDRHAEDPSRIALIYENQDGEVRNYTFRDIQKSANQFANAMLGLGVARGDRVMIVLGQTPETAIAHVGCWKAGIISSPCSVLFGADAIEYRMNNSGAKILITDQDNYPKVEEAWGNAPDLDAVLVIDGAIGRGQDFWTVVNKGSDQFETVDTLAEDPAFICYTSGTTGMPKGALHAHRCIIGHMPGMEFVNDFMPQKDDLLWSPADWAWMAGLMDILSPAWFHGLPVLAFRAPGFDPEQAYHMIAKHNVRNSLLTPTMLKMMRQVPNAMERHKVNLRSVFSGGESLGAEMYEWASENLKVGVNEAFGQTECNLVLGNCSKVMPIKAGALGRAIPGHDVAIIDDQTGEVLPYGTEGHIAVKGPNPVMLKEYWRNPKATEEKFINGWLLTGDAGTMDEDGYFWFQGRADDVITSSGYRIGPGEIENALIRHDAITMAAAIGIPDPVRTEVVKAYVLLAEGYEASPELEAEITEMVRDRLAKHEYPRQIEFVDSLPMTTTGKIQRRELRLMEAARREAKEAGK
ncbi:MAG: AMP-binding protein [Rhodospirillales bacterium]|nr:AMP-binding protein [Rhodospirillales bacterium]